MLYMSNEILKRLLDKKASGKKLTKEEQIALNIKMMQMSNEQGVWIEEHIDSDNVVVSGQGLADFHI